MDLEEFIALADSLFGQDFNETDVRYNLIEESANPQNVDFDTENANFEHDPRLPGLCGWQKTLSGIPFLGATAGGDWECPVYFLIYWDDSDKQFKKLIPTRGNVVDWENNQAYYEDKEEAEEDGALVKPDDLDFDVPALADSIEQFFAVRKMIASNVAQEPLASKSSEPERATELEWLKFFYQEADFGPGDDEVRSMIEDDFRSKTGKELPIGY